MPFSGTGSGIQNATDVYFSGLTGGQALVYNQSTSKWTNGSAGVAAAQLTGVVVEKNGTYAARPTGFANVKFIGPDDPGALAQNGDEWVKLS